MKPHIVTMRLKVKDSEMRDIETLGPVPCVPHGDIIFIRLPREKFADIRDSVQSLEAAAKATGKLFVFLPQEAEIVEIEEQWEAQK
jgi:hypothetical protein